MLKKISKITGAEALSNKEQKTIKGGFGFPDFGGDCCACTFFPAGSPFMVFITQSCDDPCPQNGATEYQDTGC